MPFDIVNDPADPGAQRSKVDSSDLDALVAGFARTGVLTGGAVTVFSTTAVAVAAGTGELVGVPFPWSAATPTIAAADGTNPRRDLVSVTSAGVVAVTAGAASATPVEPAIPASSVLLGVVEVLAGASDRTQYLSDRRVVLGMSASSTIVESNTQTGTAYTLALVDAGKAVTMNNAAANTLTVPTNATVAFPVGTVVAVEQHGAGQTTIAGAGGVTLQSRGAALKLAAQWGAASLRKTAADAWLVAGDLVT